MAGGLAHVGSGGGQGHMGLSALTVMVKGPPTCPEFTASPHWRDLRVGHGTWATEGPSWVEPLELVPWALDAVGASEQRPLGETCCQDVASRARLTL